MRTTSDERFPAPRLAYQMLMQSAAGLAAAAVDEGRGDELIWVATGDDDVEALYARTLNRLPSVAFRGVFEPWDLVERLRARGIVRGYILYRRDDSPGPINGRRPGADLSVNVATSLAGLLGGVLVDEELEPEARARGLALLADARGKTQAWCFATYRDRFNRRLLCCQDPKKPNVRDLAIARRAFTLYGDDATTAEALAWLEPLSPILGWNGGDEFETTRASTVQGHFQTATDWCVNLPVLMAGSRRAAPVKTRPFDPRSIDWDDRRGGVAFVLTDGDNVQWLEGDFFGNAEFWRSPERGLIPFGWSTCFAHLTQLVPAAVDHAAATQGAADSFLEWGGGYYYPDLFARDRPDRWALLARHARRTGELMARNGTPIVGFNFADARSADARKACEVFAAEVDGLLGILAFQYAPYEGGAGEVFWVKDRAGVEIPVVTARYSIWAEANDRPRAGTPAKVAREIRETAEAAPPTDAPRLDWAVVHAWSWFLRAPGPDEEAENTPQDDARARGARRGYAPAAWCAERLPDSVRAVAPEELLWRLRERRAPEPTRRLIREIRP
ncbi:GxGYxYP domain-containing protein [Paludisphaera soli]|uniref:GxGYxYP domain-containing protein n=1 Tax=Paludisphaera soli TaxID=2712865 RepID=UPI0013EAFEF8|nr:GxGYxYP domain-containing protein [Paludisphaera soli]